MPEIEELRLVVALDDQASAGLTKLKTSLQEISGPQSILGFERIKRSGGEMSAMLKELTSTAEKAAGVHLNLARGITGVAGAMAGLAAATFGVNALRQFANEMVNLNATAQAFGVGAASLKNITDQMRQMGIAPGDATRMVTNLASALQDLGREGSKLRLQLMQGAALGGAGAEREMADWIQRMVGFSNKGDLDKAVNEFVRGVNNAIARETERAGPALGAEIGRSLLSYFQIDPVQFAKIRDQLTGLSEAQKDAIQKAIEESVKFTRSWETMGLTIEDKIIRPIQRALLPLMSELTDEIIKSGEKWSEGLGGFIVKTAEDIKPIIKLLGMTPSEAAKTVGGGLLGHVPKYLGGTAPNPWWMGGEGEKTSTMPGAATIPQRFMGGGGGADYKFTAPPDALNILGHAPMSSNIEDRRGLVEDQTDEMTKNTAQLSRLNDLLEQMMAPGLGAVGGGRQGFLSTQMGGLAAGLGAGTGTLGGGGAGAGGGMGGLPGFGGGGGGSGGGGGGGGGQGPGPGTGAGAGQTPATMPGGTPFGPAPGAFTPMAAGGGGGTGAIVAERARVMKQLQEPGMRELTAAVIGHEQGGQGAADVLESLVNRAVVTGRHPRDLIKSGFYGPVNRGEVGKPTQQHLQDYDAAFQAVGAGRNVIGGRVDQGMLREVKPAGRMQASGGEYYGWMGLKGEQQTAAARAGRGETTGPAPSITSLATRPTEPGAISGLLGPQTPAAAGGAGALPAFRTARNAEVGKYVGFDRAVANLNPEFRARVAAAYAAMPEDVKQSFVMNEGWRSFEYQQHLYETRSGRGMVGRPGHSRHETGQAIDVDTGPAREWLRAHGGEFGIEGLRGDAPHFQLARGYKGPAFAGRADAIAPVSIARTRPTTDVALDRSVLDRALLSKSDTAKVEGTGKLTVDVKAPNGTKVAAEGGGLFKKTEVNRATQMEKAESGPPAAEE